MDDARHRVRQATCDMATSTVTSSMTQQVPLEQSVWGPRRDSKFGVASRRITWQLVSEKLVCGAGAAVLFSPAPAANSAPVLSGVGLETGPHATAARATVTTSLDTGTSRERGALSPQPRLRAAIKGAEWSLFAA